MAMVFSHFNTTNLVLTDNTLWPTHPKPVERRSSIFSRGGVQQQRHLIFSRRRCWWWWWWWWWFVRSKATTNPFTFIMNVFAVYLDCILLAQHFSDRAVEANMHQKTRSVRCQWYIVDTRIVP